jgi:metal-responsive CopG/Arc/MetJ family transcriptional regulator
MLPSFDYKKARSFSLSTELSDEIDEVCQMLGLQRSGFVNQALETYLKHFRMQLEKLDAKEETLAA